MQHMMMSRAWIDRHSAQPANAADRSEDRWKKIWEFGWPLLFVVAMTLFSLFGPRTEYSKQLPDPPMASQPMLHSIK